MTKNPIYYYNTEGQCFILKEVKEQYCQLHGEYIGINVWGTLIKTSGKPSNVLYSTPINFLHLDSKNYLTHLGILKE